MNSRFLLRCALCLALGTVGMQTANADNFASSTYDAAKTDIKNTYRAERDKCAALTGNTKDICIEQAKANEKVALAQLQANYSGSTKDEEKLVEAKYKARYDVAKERCDDLSGDAKDLCLQTAKTARDKAAADAKQHKATAEAAEDADNARMKADYQLAAERCNTLAGEAKDVCIASAKARYAQRW